MPIERFSEADSPSLIMSSVHQKVDYLIVGLGLAGSALAWELIQRDKTVLVLDLPADQGASAVAAGLVNPVTGKFLNKAWNADIIFPFFENFQVLHKSLPCL